MFFVHPQIKINKRNLSKIWNGFSEDVNSEALTRKLEPIFPGKKIVFTDMARSAFKVIIEQFNLRDSTMMMPAYICDIFYPIIKEYGIKPIFLDIDTASFHLQIEEIRRKKNPDVKAILISHTYGLPVDIEKLKKVITEIQNSNFESALELARDKPQTSNPEPLIIEDCAHAFGGRLKGSYAGNLGDVSFFSLYKQFPVFRGGMLVCPKDWKIKELPQTHFSLRDFISFLNSFPLFAFLFKSFGNKVASHFIRKEKMSEPAGLNSVSLNFFHNFLDDQQTTIKHRIELGKMFQKGLKELGFQVQEAGDNVFCYLSGLIPAKLENKRDELVERLRGRGIFCTRIWHTPIVLNPEVQKEYHLDLNEFPNTVEAANRVINFPLQNYYQEKDIKKMVSSIREALKDINSKKK